MHLQEQRKAQIPAEELNQIFKEAVNERAKSQTLIKHYLKKTVEPEVYVKYSPLNYKKLPGIDNRLANTENAVTQLMEKVETFNQTIGQELDEVTNKLQKIRDQLAGKDRK
jgi:hypothetical protein